MYLNWGKLDKLKKMWQHKPDEFVRQVYRAYFPEARLAELTATGKGREKVPEDFFDAVQGDLNF